MSYRIWVFRASVAATIAVAWFQHVATAEERRQAEFKQPPGEFAHLYETAPDGRTVPRLVADGASGRRRSRAFGYHRHGRRKSLSESLRATRHSPLAGAMGNPRPSRERAARARAQSPRG